MKLTIGVGADFEYKFVAGLRGCVYLPRGGYVHRFFFWRWSYIVASWHGEKLVCVYSSTKCTWGDRIFHFVVVEAVVPLADFTFLPTGAISRQKAIVASETDMWLLIDM